MTNHRQLYAVSNRPRSSSERPFSSEDDINYKPRIVHEMTNHAKTPKENQKNIRTQNYLSSNELLQTPNSSNQRARLSWHGPDKVATPQHSAHVTMRNSSRSDDRQAQVIWGDQKRRVTIGEVILPGYTFERAITHPQHPNNYKTVNNLNRRWNVMNLFSRAFFTFFLFIIRKHKITSRHAMRLRFPMLMRDHGEWIHGYLQGCLVCRYC